MDDAFIEGAPGMTASIRLRQGGRHLLRVADGSWSLHLRVVPGEERLPEPALYSRGRRTLASATTSPASAPTSSAT